MRGLSLCWAGALGLASLVVGTPLQDGPGRREETSTVTSVVWKATTTTLPASTTTVNPRDSTVYITLGTAIEYAFTTSSVTTSSCVTYSYQDPKPTVPVVTVTVTSTATVPNRPTVTATDSLRPVTTVYSVTLSVLHTSVGQTIWSTKCTNTLVESFFVASTTTYTALPSVTAHTRVTVTSVCLVSSLVSLTVHGGPIPTTDPYVPGISRFTGKETVLTVKMPTSTAVTVTVPDRTSTSTETVCNNPNTVVTSVWYVVTVTPPPTTSTVTRKDCDAPPSVTGAAAAPAEGLAARGPEARENVKARRAHGGPHGQVQARAGETQTPAETKTVTFTTIGLVDNEVATSQATAVYAYYTQTFTTVEMEPVTVTASAPVKYVSVCPKS